MDSPGYEEYAARLEDQRISYQAKQKAKQAGKPKQPEYRKVNPDGIHPKLKAMDA